MNYIPSLNFVKVLLVLTLLLCSSLMESGEAGLEGNRDGKLNEDSQIVLDRTSPDSGDSGLGDNRESPLSTIVLYTMIIIF